jgi:flagellar secretion chaperone FliS
MQTMNDSQRRSEYLESKILTAPPHKLHLALVEGAIRFGRMAEASLRSEDPNDASRLLMKVLDILGEMVAGVRGAKTTLSRKIADFYLFLFRLVSEAKVNDDVDKLCEALRLLEFERQTWQLVCEKLHRQSPHTTQRPAAVPLAGPPLSRAVPSPGLSLEA